MPTPADFSRTPHEVSMPSATAAAQGKDAIDTAVSPTELARLRFGVLKGVVVVPANFDVPLPDDVQASFEKP